MSSVSLLYLFNSLVKLCTGVYSLSLSLSFHLQVPGGWDNLSVFLIPLDIGKPTAKTERVPVNNGTCTWEDPIYETVKLTKDPKSGKFEEKNYQFIVSPGSSKGNLLGEITFNFAVYAEALKPSSLSSPLKASNSGTILHVTIQRLLSGDNSECEKSKSYTEVYSKSIRRQISDCDADVYSKASESTYAVEEFSPNAGSVQEPAFSLSNMDSNLRASNSSSASSSDSVSGHEFPHGVELRNNSMHQDTASFLSFLSSNTKLQKNVEKETTKVLREKQESHILETKTSREILDGSETREARTLREKLHESDYEGKLLREKLYGSLTGEAKMLREKLHESESSIEKLNNEIAILARQAEVSDLEVQTLRKQIMKESRRGNDLSKEIHVLREERETLKKELELVKNSPKKNENVKILDSLRREDLDSTCIFEEIKQELEYEKEMNTNLRLQLQKTQESNTELILAVRDLDELLEQKNRETHATAERESSCTSRNQRPEIPYTDERGHHCISCKQRIEAPNVDQRKNYHEAQNQALGQETEEDSALEALVKDHKSTDMAYSLEQKIAELNEEIEAYKKDHENLETQMEQLALDYEILKQANHNLTLKLEQTQLQEQLKIQYECSLNLAMISDLETQVENLEKEIEKQAEAFEADLAALTIAKVEQEKRAIWAEETLKKTKWNNASMAEKLQDEFKFLSQQVNSTFEANEKLSMDALTEASELRLVKTHLQESLDKVYKDLEAMKDQYESRVLELTNQLEYNKEENEKLQLRLEQLSVELESRKASEQAKIDEVSSEISTLKMEIETLGGERDTFAKEKQEKEKLRVEMEQMKILIEEKDAMLQQKNIEISKLETEAAATARGKAGRAVENLHAVPAEDREEKEQLMAKIKQMKMLIEERETILREKEMEITILEREAVLRGEEVKKAQEVLYTLKSAEEEREAMVQFLKSELESSTSQYNELKHALYEDEVEKENLRKQLFHLKGDLKKKEDSVNTMEKKLKDCSSRVANSVPASKLGFVREKNKSAPRGLKEATSLRERVKLLEGEVKLKEAALENSKKEFVKREKDLHERIKELEKGVRELAQENPNSCTDEYQINSFNNQNGETLRDEKDVPEILEATVDNSSVKKLQGYEKMNAQGVTEVKSIHKNTIVVESPDSVMEAASQIPDPKRNYVEQVERIVKNDSTMEQKLSLDLIDDRASFIELMNELEFLKMKNKSMEDELKEMQGRYSEISLKFAEVEGERQQLVMTVRNLKNSKKN
ncbi:putative leucine-rich repeat-containing protein DDB_G0290503 isoform X2 [Amborella trichopoda]|uniref:putative leucine-rich repeat-containing protein DDB_G0290503 isoform X2 n=1 Tax=Amborella trichopoda TaxID=13333 RepID=UPI0009BCB2E2|nr:putative leucine-rich repeat-containing protein DDB_G0290503 isoform X2 [Amborella trichopoda]|eukprot:XP_020527558.1 putative leucine-rich repeat-containing protein DDB_G0290503 isoform X2 [Amborella trichopoda]